MEEMHTECISHRNEVAEDAGYLFKKGHGPDMVARFLNRDHHYIEAIPAPSGEGSYVTVAFDCCGHCIKITKVVSYTTEDLY